MLSSVYDDVLWTDKIALKFYSIIQIIPGGRNLLLANTQRKIKLTLKYEGKNEILEFEIFYYECISFVQTKTEVEKVGWCIKRLKL